MTAEVAIMNRHAIALAADSAVTVGGGKTVKIYNTVNKLFMLSKHEPVGIMVYSSADLVGCPVETVIKFFRSRILVNKKLPKLLDYADEFFNYLETDNTILNDDLREAAFYSVVNEILCVVEKVIRFSDNGPAVLSDAIMTLKTRKRILGYTSAKGKNLKNSISRYTDEWTSSGQNFAIGSELKNEVKTFLFESLSRFGEISLQGVRAHGVYTGIVIAGFGESEAFPSLVEFRLTYSAFGLTKFDLVDTRAISHSNGAEIVGFAQTDQIESFMFGRAKAMDYVLGSILHRSFDSHIDQLLASLPKLTGAERQGAREVLQSIRDDVKSAFAKELDQWEINELRDLQNAIYNLPKEDLAMIGEALINLTIAKRRASSNSETVGPPVDVAVISKGDGFVWMKRKHYFDPDLNVHFSQNYLSR